MMREQRKIKSEIFHMCFNSVSTKFTLFINHRFFSLLNWYYFVITYKLFLVYKKPPGFVLCLFYFCLVGTNYQHLFILWENQWYESNSISLLALSSFSVYVNPVLNHFFCFKRIIYTKAMTEKSLEISNNAKPINNCFKTKNLTILQKE